MIESRHRIYIYHIDRNEGAYVRVAYVHGGGKGLKVSALTEGLTVTMIFSLGLTEETPNKCSVSILIKLSLLGEKNVLYIR